MAKWYINYQYEKQPIETLDEYDNYREAKLMLREHQLAYKGTPSRVWISKRATKDWYQK